MTSQEFTSIVTESLENVSETGVTENTELASATTSQNIHSNQYNVNGTVSGSYGPVTATVAAGFSSQDQNSASASDSAKHAVETTRKASSRVRQEHKTTISTKTETGTAESSTRILRNPDPVNPIRVDYFSLMRKWHVGLYRYGLRLTYDIAIPEPGAEMRSTYAKLDQLQQQIGPFDFSVAHASITEANFQQLADQFGAQVPLPPQGNVPDIFTHANPPASPESDDGTGVAIFDMPPLQIPDGYWVKELHLAYHFESHKGDHQAKISIMGSSFIEQGAQMDFPQPPPPDKRPDDLTKPENGSY